MLYRTLQDPIPPAEADLDTAAMTASAAVVALGEWHLQVLVELRTGASVVISTPASRQAAAMGLGDRTHAAHGVAPDAPDAVGLAEHVADQHIGRTQDIPPRVQRRLVPPRGRRHDGAAAIRDRATDSLDERPRL
jgi:hypothetical protein